MSYLTYKDDLNIIIYSEYFRSIQNKTQLFYYEEGNHFRTRLIHTLEVEKIALNISNGLNQKLKEKKKKISLNLTLVQAIALSHDIGHTPFGHVGERVIDGILSRKDTIGLLNEDHKNLIFFKHNINSAKILEKLNINNFEIIDGVCKHSKIVKSNYDYGNQKFDPYGLKKMYKGKYVSYALNPYAFTLEGQVVAIADEIAQRISDIDDILDNRHIEKIKDFLPTNQGSPSESKSKVTVEELIYNTFICDVIENSFSNMEKREVDKNGYYDKLVISLSDEYVEVNKSIEEYITNYIALSEKVRMSDSNSKYILRQLFKALYNDITLLPDLIIKKFFDKIKNEVSSKKQLFLNNKNLQEIKDLAQLLDSVIADKIYLSSNKAGLDMKKVLSFYQIIKKIEDEEAIDDKIFVVNDYLEMIGHYLASLNDNDARYLFEKIYR